MDQKEKRAKFEMFYRKNEHDMYKVALYFTQQDQAAMEITQKAFYHLYLRFENVDPRFMRTYVSRTIRNMTYNWTRDNKIAKEGNIEDYYEDLIVEGMDEIYIRKEEKETARALATSLMSALYEKNTRWYETVMDVYYLNISQEKVAQNEGVAKDVISSRLYRAKQWLRQNYREEYDKAMEN